MPINRKLFYPALILAASLLIQDLGLLARGGAQWAQWLLAWLCEPLQR